LWGGFAIFWEFQALTNAPKDNAAGWIGPLIGIPFVLFGLHFMFGRFVLDARLRDRTEYALTDRRAIIVSSLFGRRIRSVNLHTTSEMTITEKADGSGTIAFGAAPPYGWRTQNNLWSPGTSQQPAFEMIDNVRSVYSIIESAKGR